MVAFSGVCALYFTLISVLGFPSCLTSMDFVFPMFALSDGGALYFNLISVRGSPSPLSSVVPVFFMFVSFVSRTLFYFISVPGSPSRLTSRVLVIWRWCTLFYSPSPLTSMVLVIPMFDLSDDCALYSTLRLSLTSMVLVFPMFASVTAHSILPSAFPDIYGSRVHPLLSSAAAASSHRSSRLCYATLVVKCLALSCISSSLDFPFLRLSEFFFSFMSSVFLSLYSSFSRSLRHRIFFSSFCLLYWCYSPLSPLPEKYSAARRTINHDSSEIALSFRLLC